jgi:hypothetical protein
MQQSKTEHVSLIFKLRHSFQETELAALGLKAMKNVGPTFFWVLGGFPLAGSDRPFEYYIIPSEAMAKNVSEAHELWLSTPGKKGQSHNGQHGANSSSSALQIF